MPDRIVSPSVKQNELVLDLSLRPKKLAEYIGQDKVKGNLKILLEAAKARGEAVDHILLYGPSGLGKTTLANIIANEMNAAIKITAGPSIERPGDLAAIVTNLRVGDILFIEEVHRLTAAVKELLFSAMQGFTIDLITGKGPSARSVRLKLPHFTVVGSTTRLDLLSWSERNSFGAIFHLDYYDLPAMETIVERSARILGAEIEPQAIREIAHRSRGTPRVANRLLKRVRDFAQVRAEGVITAQVARQALALMDIDELGLDEIDRKVPLTIIEKFDGGPVGLETIAKTVNEEPYVLEEVYEPYLMQLGFLNITPHGRVATKHAYDHMRRRPPERMGGNLI